MSDFTPVVARLREKNLLTYAPADAQVAAKEVGVEVTSRFWKVMGNPAARVGRGQYNLEVIESTMNGSPAPKVKKTRVTKVAAATVTAIREAAPTPVVEAVSMTQKSARNENFSYVPAVDPEYVPFGNYKDLKRIISSKLFFPVMITGHSGNGKSTQVMQIHAELKRPMIRINMTKKTDEEMLIGTKTLLDGNVIVVEGPLLVAMRSGCTVLIDEIDAGDPNTLLCLQTIMEGRPYFFASIGEYVTPAPGFNIIMTANTKGKGSDDGRYIGTNVLNEAFLERIGLTFEQEYPTPAIEKKIVLGFMRKYGKMDEEFAQQLVTWADAIRRTFQDGGVDDLIATRRLEHIVRAYAVFDDKQKALELGVARFDAATKVGFLELFQKMFKQSTPVVTDPTATAEVNTDMPF